MENNLNVRLFIAYGNYLGPPSAPKVPARGYTPCPADENRTF